MLTSLAYIFILSLALGALFSKFRLPSLIGMLLSGILLGPFGFDLISEQLLNISIELRQIALVIILMRAGLALNINDLKKVGRPALLLCFLPALFEIGAITLLAPKLLGISTLEAALLGSVVAAVSPAVIVPKMLNLMEHKIGTKKSIPQMIMAGGSVDDVFVIVLFGSFTLLLQGGELSAMSFGQIPISIALGLILGVATALILVKFFKVVHLRDSVKLLILLSCGFLFLAAEQSLKGVVPISGLLAVMALGCTILQKHELLAKRISPKFNKLWVGAEIVLFVMVGASVDINYATGAGSGAVIIIGGALLFRMIGVFCCMIKSNLNLKERLFCMIAYLPKATVQAAIGSIPLALGLPCGNLVLTVAVLSILITAPLGAIGIDATYKKLLTKGN